MEIFAVFFICMFSLVLANQEERLPNKCEVCKLLTVELQDALEKNWPLKGSSGKKIQIWSLRYAKGTSQTMNTLKNLMDKGVKVELGIPYELWDEPSVEVADLKRQCESMLEEYEEVVENWYFHHQDERFDRFFCAAHVLRDSDQECLNEVWKGDMGVKGSKEESEGENGRQNHDAGEL
uniref:Protein canopy 4-like n=1 Tax=Sinocyclocheilus anshuiensis TaxID=1608454 RepID=A0A671NK13_9TELE